MLRKYQGHPRYRQSRNPDPGEKAAALGGRVGGAAAAHGDFHIAVGQPEINRGPKLEPEVGGQGANIPKLRRQCADAGLRVAAHHLDAVVRIVLADVVTNVLHGERAAGGSLAAGWWV